MNLGIGSDSHGRVHHLRRALEMLQSAGADAFIHCGDIGGVDAIDELAGRRCWFVWGNTDDPHPTWRKYMEDLGMSWPTGPLELELAGKRVSVFHGHERQFQRTLDAADHDYLLHGHTHRRDDYRLGKMRVINPGALHRVAVRKVALLDLDRDHLEFLEV